MDTDDLTEMAYGIIIRAGETLDVLKTEIGASALPCRTEDQFLKAALEFLDKILADPIEYLDDWNCLDSITHQKFVVELQGLRQQIAKTMGPGASKGLRRTKCTEAGNIGKGRQALGGSP
jgi:hypothetical protein